jgi:hypothetical protein
MPSGQRGKLTFFDSTLSASCTWTGSNWINSSGAVV